MPEEKVSRFNSGMSGYVRTQPPAADAGPRQSKPLGMDYWWDKFCDDHAYDHEPEHTSVKQACEFAQWFADQCAEPAPPPLLGGESCE